MPQKESRKLSKALVVKRIDLANAGFVSEEKAPLIKSEYGHHFATLFRPLSDRKPRKRKIIKWVWKFDREIQFPNTILKFDELEYEFWMFEELGEDDLKVFLRLIQVSDRNGKVILDPWMEEYEGINEQVIRQLNLFSDCKSRTENSRTLPVVRSEKPMSYNTFFRPILKGRFSKKDKKRLENSLNRLASTTVFITAKLEGRKIRRMSSNLASFIVDYETGRFLIALNPFVTNAILGNPLGGYRPLIDGRVFQLKGTAVIVLTWLSAWLLPGKSGKVSLDKLKEHIYGDKSENKKVRYWRRRQLRKALDQISKLGGWEIQEVQKGMFKIKRSSHLQSYSEK